MDANWMNVDCSFRGRRPRLSFEELAVRMRPMDWMLKSADLSFVTVHWRQQHHEGSCMEVACEYNFRRRDGPHHILSCELLDTVRTLTLTINYNLPRQKLQSTSFGPFHFESPKRYLSSSLTASSALAFELRRSRRAEGLFAEPYGTEDAFIASSLRGRTRLCGDNGCELDECRLLFPEVVAVPFL